MPGPVFLENETVTLRPAEQDDISFLRENEQDPRVRASRSVHLPVDSDWGEERVGGTMGRDGDTIGLFICDEQSPVGFVYLLREQPSAEVFRFGELAYWITPDEMGNGYATAGSGLILSYAFNELGLHRVDASTFDSNEASRRVLEKLGFTEEGRSRRKALVDGKWTDMVRFGLLSDEWEE